MIARKPSITTFDFKPGRLLAGKYRVEQRLGGGTEGEVYRVVEARTGIPRAAKVFYPQQNPRDRAVRHYANKLNRLKDCPVVIQYHHAESIRFRGTPVSCLMSELVEGEPLTDFLRRQPNRRMEYVEALLLLRELASGLEQIHRAGEYHGDVHEGNILISRRGIGFHVKLLDLMHHGRVSSYHVKEDVIQLIRVFYETLGGRRTYSAHPPEIKAICCGLRRTLIKERFPTAKHLLEHLDTLEWSSR